MISNFSHLQLALLERTKLLKFVVLTPHLTWKLTIPILLHYLARWDNPWLKMSYSPKVTPHNPSITAIRITSGIAPSLSIWNRCLGKLLFVYLFIYCFTAQVLKVCRTPGPTTCSKTKMLHLDKACLKS